MVEPEVNSTVLEISSLTLTVLKRPVRLRLCLSMLLARQARSQLSLTLTKIIALDLILLRTSSLWTARALALVSSRAVARLPQLLRRLPPPRLPQLLPPRLPQLKYLNHPQCYWWVPAFLHWQNTYGESASEILVRT